MITVKVGEPTSKAVGDIWFDPTERVTRKAQVFHPAQSFTPVVVWGPLSQPIGGSSNIFGFPPNPTKGDVYIEPINNIPNLFDGTSWIPAVPAGYHFPPFTPQDGDQWTESLSQINYMYHSGKWMRMTAQATQSTQVTHLPVGGNWFIPTGGSWVAPGAAAPTPPVIVPPGGTMQNINLAPVAAGGGNNIVIAGSVPSATMAQPQSSNITIHGPNNQAMVIFDTKHGTVTFGPGYTPDAAAQIFWRAIASTSPKFLQAQIDDLVKDLKDVTSRLAVAEGNVLKFTQAGYKLPEPQKPLDPSEAWERAMGIIK
jgi:hypothetical protein